MLYFLGFLVLAILLGAIYAVIALMEIPGIADERLGTLEPLPPLDVWSEDRTSEEGKAAAAEGLVRETRVFLDPAGGWLGRGRLIQQARYRDPRRDDVVRTEPDRRFRRRRRRA